MEAEREKMVIANKNTVAADSKARGNPRRSRGAKKIVWDTRFRQNVCRWRSGGGKFSAPRHLRACGLSTIRQQTAKREYLADKTALARQPGGANGDAPEHKRKCRRQSSTRVPTDTRLWLLFLPKAVRALQAYSLLSLPLRCAAIEDGWWM